MTRTQIEETLEKLNELVEDFQIVRDGKHNFDKNSCETSIDNLNDIIRIIENE